MFRTLSDSIARSGDPDLQANWTEMTREYAASGQLLPVFMALAKVSPSLREMLAGLRISDDPQTIDTGNADLNQFLDKSAKQMTDQVMKMSLGQEAVSRVGLNRLDALADVLTQAKADRRFEAEKLVANTTDAVNEYVSDMIGRGSAAANTALNKLSDAISDGKFSKYPKMATRMGAFIASLGSKDRLDGTISELQGIMNGAQGWEEFRALMNDVIGGREDNLDRAGNFGLLRRMNQAKAKVDAVRQDARKQVPYHLNKHFTRKVTEEEQTTLYRGIAQLDLSVLGPETTDILREQSLVDTRITALEKSLVATVGNKRLQVALTKAAQDLAYFLNTKKVRNRKTFRNAYAISHNVLQGVELTEGTTLEDVALEVDRLTSLYALRDLDQDTKDRLSELAQSEPEGVQALVNFHRVQRGWELTQNYPGATPGSLGAVPLSVRLNSWKNYTPTDQLGGTNLWDLGSS